jgi:hypothetical protein
VSRLHGLPVLGEGVPSRFIFGRSGLELIPYAVKAKLDPVMVCQWSVRGRLRSTLHDLPSARIIKDNLPTSLFHLSASCSFSSSSGNAVSSASRDISEKDCCKFDMIPRS